MRRTTRTSISPLPDSSDATGTATGGLAESAVLLVGHGSHLSPASALPVHSLAEELRYAAPDIEVRVAFWKEEPLLHQAFDLVEAARVFVVPVFTSEGYFTDSVLPRELGLRGRITVTDGRRIHYCPPVGTHPSMARIVLARAEEVGAEDDATDRALVIVGHGTDRHPRSADSTLALVEEVRAAGRFARVEPAFLDQDPPLGDVLRFLAADGSPSVVVVPFFISEGWHAGTTIPRDLAATSVRAGSRPSGSGRLAYTGAVGTHPLMAAAVLDLVRDALEAPSDERPEDEAAPFVAREAREDFIAWIRAGGASGREFLQAVVRESGQGSFEIRHCEDRGAAPEELATFEDPHDGGAITRTTDEGTYRPLSTTPDLRRGWRIAGLDERGVWEAFAGLYPTAPVHWHLARAGVLRVVGFDQAAGRQTGMYEHVVSLGEDAVSRLVRGLCSPECLRAPRWPTDALPLVMDDGAVPCLEPCSVFLSRAREALDAPEGSG